MKSLIARTNSITNQIGIAIVFATMLFLGSASAMAQTSTFTYQGRLTDGGGAANGAYDMQFKLFDGSGNQIGSTTTNPNVTVTNGVFTVQLDYGAAAFPGADRLLEISLRPAGSGEAYTVLSPRQPLTSTPYAIRAAVADNATQLAGIAANQYVTTSSGPANFIQNATSQQTANFNISGTGAVGGALSAGAVNSASNYSIGGKPVFSVIGLHNISIGKEAGVPASGNVQNNTFVGGWAVNQTQNSGNSFFGSHAGENSNGAANSIFGAFSGSSFVNGSFNSIFGQSAGDSVQLGNHNSLFGYVAGGFAGGSDNSYFGSESGVSGGGSGSSNSFFGRKAGQVNFNGFDNSFFGMEAGVTNKDGFENAFFGRSAGKSNFGGSSNAFFGMEAGSANSNGALNTFVGRSSGLANVNGSNNTLIGAATDLDSSALNFATAIGSGAHVSTSNTIVLGRPNASDAVRVPGGLTVGTLGAAGSTSLCRNVVNQIATCSSSLRYKTNIQPFVGGLSLLNRLRPITFAWKQGGLADIGFGAEDIAAVEPLLVTRNDKDEVEGVKYDRISAVLVNAVKEQQGQIKRQQSEIENLRRLVCARHRRAPQCRK